MFCSHQAYSISWGNCLTRGSGHVFKCNMGIHVHLFIFFFIFFFLVHMVWTVLHSDDHNVKAGNNLPTFSDF